MFDDLAALFVENVLRAYDEYATQRDSKTVGRNRHMSSALQAAAALYHFREHLPTSHKLTRSQVVQACPEYRLVADVENVAKHGELTRPTSEGPALVSTTADLEESAVIVRYGDGDGVYTDTTSRIYVACTDGVRRNLDEHLTTVVNFWGGQLKAWGIYNYDPRPAPSTPGAAFVNRADAAPPSLQMMQGLRFKQTMALMEFDADKGHAVPIDLTGADLTLKIYRPAYELNIAVRTHDGSEFDHAISLTDDESQELAALQTDDERRAFSQKIFESRQAEIADEIGRRTYEDNQRSNP